MTDGSPWRYQIKQTLCSNKDGEKERVRRGRGEKDEENDLASFIVIEVMTR